MKTSRTDDAIATVIGALRSEESELTEEISQMQARVGAVRAAMASMGALLPAQETGKQASLPISFDDGAYSFEGMPFTKALTKYMRTLNAPATVKEITEGFKVAGFKFASQNDATQVYVSLKRNEGKLFKRVGNKWQAIPS